MKCKNYDSDEGCRKLASRGAGIGSECPWLGEGKGIETCDEFESLCE